MVILKHVFWTAILVDLVHSMLSLILFPVHCRQLSCSTSDFIAPAPPPLGHRWGTTGAPLGHRWGTGTVRNRPEPSGTRSGPGVDQEVTRSGPGVGAGQRAVWWTSHKRRLCIQTWSPWRTNWNILVHIPMLHDTGMYCEVPDVIHVFSCA